MFLSADITARPTCVETVQIDCYSSMAWAEIQLAYFLLLTICIATPIKALKSTLFYLIIAENGFVISSGEFSIAEWVGVERKSCSNGRGWKSDAAGTDGDGNHI